ncbi:hypothetical protein BC829DRAFT_482783 [Chytridium lagenaria]|nr:hypothetical protein BC829DRAFT_482783 [Chytridium lagenaria]
MLMCCCIIRKANYRHCSSPPSYPRPSSPFKLLAIYSRSHTSASSPITLSYLLPTSSHLPRRSLSHHLSPLSPFSLLARADIPAIIMAFPIPTQPGHVTQCLLASKHVLSEKSISPSLALTRPLLALDGSRKQPLRKPPPSSIISR